MMVKVCGKGGKERYTLLSKVTLETLRDYWKYTIQKNGFFAPTCHKNQFQPGVKFFMPYLEMSSSPISRKAIILNS
jgi:site-specific recombinase XerD